LQESKKAFKSLKRNRQNNCETEYDSQNMIRKKRQFRSLQRQAHASKQRNFIQEIMDASENDSKTFSKLINKQRTNDYKGTGSLIVNGENVTKTEDILEQWKHHFQKLAIPNFITEFDLERLTLVEMQNKVIEEQQLTIGKRIQPVTITEVLNAITNMKSGKARDENGIGAEHYKYASEQIAPFICECINAIFSKLDIPSSLKSGLLTPVLKKGKDPTTPGNYRGITVTRNLSKILESILKSRIDPILNQTQNCLQRGFTEKVSSLNAALVVSEAHHYADTKDWPFYLATLDAEKAFDTVHHEILFNKIFHDGINGDMWILLRNLYRDMSVKVKWKGTTSNPISLKQGIRQGDKLSTTLYKRYNNTILDSITRSHMGATIGTLLVSSPTCADDIALIANTRAELQGMLDLVQYNTNRDLVKINATKSEIFTSAKTKDKDSFIFNGQNIEQTSSTKHLGITRTKFCKVNIEERLQSGHGEQYMHC